MLYNLQNSLGRLLRKKIYKERISKFKKIIIVILIGGMLLSGLYTVRHIYIEYAVSKAHVSFVYPEIADGLYPNGSRFSIYDLISRDRLQEALEIMQKRGKYTDLVVDDLLNSFEIYDYLENSIGDIAEAKRTEGQNYSYYSNEYVVIFVQPHAYRSSNLIDRIYSKDYSAEFLYELLNVNKNYIAEMYGGIGGFQSISEIGDLSNYDYAEKVAYYNNNINVVINLLNMYSNDSSGFVSSRTGYSFSDLRNSYNALKIEQLDSIASFIKSSYLTSDLQEFLNKTKTDILTNTLKYNKLSDQAGINEYAMKSYDHTFTENLIVVSVHEDEGLYQARPKTAYDKVVQQYLEAKNLASASAVDIAKCEKDLENYSEISSASAEYTRLRRKCDNLIEQFEEKYNELAKIADSTISDYLDTRNNGYLTSKVAGRNVFSKRAIMKMAVSFGMGGVFAFILYMLRDEFKSRRKAARKRQIIDRFSAVEGGLCE